MQDFDSEAFVARVRQRLTDLGLTPRAASLLAGANPDLIRGILRGANKSVRGDHLVGLARALKVSESWLITGQAADDTAEDPAPQGIGYGGIVQAGIFRPHNDYDQTGELRRVPLAPDPRFPASEQAAFDVAGDSMNGEPARIMDGMKVHTVSRAAWERRYVDIPDGAIVVVARFRDGLPERELTLKRLRYFRDRWELRPESTNPAHTPLVFPLASAQDEPVQVEILAVVLAAAWLYG